ncbi:peptide/nickel transport system ATP-binding protein [Leucobacter exalbidus]|uniref:Peptide/nickel transport system ATP-binding protein n=1 Tax=Leucobacter exalbidus TaxID=662960 RepID=A0A940PN69_9MICO|nr:ABC transporter ATP-binding protein [Leucobacter exalbidus]MBP1326243.1 peptide/nickel transport system ATP-binding protein [Leucobacter exalbidus]
MSLTVSPETNAAGAPATVTQTTTAQTTSASTVPLLSIRDLAVQYRTSGGDVDAVHGVSFDVAAGQVTAIVGESGSGKTSVAQSVIGLLPSNGRVARGSIVFNERREGATELTRLSERSWHGLRGRCIALIPQDPGNSLNPIATIGTSVAESLRIHGLRDRTKVRNRVIELLEQVGIDDAPRRAKQYPHELSGGMRQRVLIAAAIASKPELIIADEPTSALDVTVQRTVLDLLDDLRREQGTGVLFITHDLAVAADRADSVVVMRSGAVQEAGPAAQVLAHPESAYTQQLIADAPSFGRVVEREHIQVTERADQPGATNLLTVSNLRQEFAGARGTAPFVAVNDVSFAVPRGTTHAIVGESGSGKTTTGRAIAGFARPTSGSVSVAGEEVVGLSKQALREFRRTTQMVYQNPYGSLDPRRSIGQTLAEPLRNFGIGERRETGDRVAQALELVALPAEFAKRRPRELSGGQRQRVAIARALIVEPDLVVLDEAVSALDVTVQAQILRLLADLQRELGLTYVFISHDLAVVRQISDTVSVLQRGRQVEYGDAEQVFSNPQDPYTRQLLDAIPGQAGVVPTRHW